MNSETNKKSFLKDKLFLDEHTDIIQNCNSKCIKSYEENQLLQKEQLCLEKCFFKYSTLLYSKRNIENLSFSFQ